MDNFTIETFELLENVQGKKGAKGDDSYKKLVDAEELTGEIARKIQTQRFPEGGYKVLKKPTNQAGNYKGYTWAKIYPNKEQEYKNIAFTVGVDSEGFVFKIDTVDINSKKRKIYEEYRSNKEIVFRINPEESVTKTSDELVDWCIYKLNDESISLIEKYNECLNLLIADKENINEKNDNINQKQNNKTSSLVYTKETQLLDSKKQIILYGPAGTGKTFNTKNIIVNHELKEKAPTKKEEIDKKYKELQDQGRVKFVTFHQSFAYEDFIEGIKPIPEDRDVKYDIQDGIFKKLCKVAANDKLYKGLEVTSKRSSYKIVRITEDLIYLKKENGMVVPIFREVVDGFIEYIYKNNIDIVDFTADKKTSKEVFGDVVDDYLIGSYSGLYNAVILHLLNNNDVESQNYYLIIDEINRGNISKIFGELITLLESSKRLCEDNELTTTLPYSKEEFGIPPNLYIIGTMNTSDKSIAHLDIALRRRFGFVEMLPDPEILENSECKSLLQELNQRIEILLDKDHLIGHSFFCGKSKEDIPTVMQNEIVPLLEEYFYGDYEKIQLVLGNNNLSSEKYDIKNNLIKKLIDSSNKEFEYKYWFQLEKDFDSSLGEKAVAEGE
ncbi:McrB family protein [Francisella philomiragia]|uniref:AAA domain family protein n=1 Tax=Francisella philomiragia TaxID=28110 RepID=A0A0B6D5H6_9GAMM|nr:AAA family ATPase [Francisella philomiragia]AJI53552.1 AAA domain family protein [Francisella philomiragia]